MLFCGKINSFLEANEFQACSKSIASFFLKLKPTTPASKFGEFNKFFSVWIDKSFITPGTDPSGLAIIGPAAKGPIEIPTEITNYNSFKEIFGTTVKSGSQAYEYFTNLAVKNYFDNGGSSAIVTRVVSASGTWGVSSNTHLSSFKYFNQSESILSLILSW